MSFEWFIEELLMELFFLEAFMEHAMVLFPHDGDLPPIVARACGWRGSAISQKTLKQSNLGVLNMYIS